MVIYSKGSIYESLFYHLANIQESIEVFVNIASIYCFTLDRMISAALPAGVVYTFLWFVPVEFDALPSSVKFIYYLLLYFSFQALLTVSAIINKIVF